MSEREVEIRRALDKGRIDSAQPVRDLLRIIDELRCEHVLPAEMLPQLWVDDLVRSAGVCLKAFRSGHQPTFKQLDRLEGALFPFTNDKICGHKMTEQCDCMELNRIIATGSAR